MMQKITSFSRLNERVGGGTLRNVLGSTPSTPRFISGKGMNSTDET
jgi:hypothetical protein